MSYRLDYGKRAAKCRGPKPCKDTPIPKGTLRCGTAVTISGNTTMQWRHYGCITAKVFQNLKESFDEADEIDGFEDLTDEDKDKVRKAFEQGHVDDADIPDSARKPESEGEGEGEGGGGDDQEDDKPKKKKTSPKKRKKSEAADDEEEEEEKPKKKKAPAKKQTKKKAKKEESDEESEAVSSEEEKPKKKAAPKKKATKAKTSKASAKKEESDEE